ncbi:MAG: hypothetical protein ACAI43_15590 [Phycisphaerae bacterium]
MKHPALAMFVLASSLAASGETPTSSAMPWPSVPLTLAAMPAGEAKPAAGGDRFELTLSFPLWLPTVDGDLTIRGRELDLSQDVGDSLDVFTGHVNAVLPIHVEARRDRVGVLLDVMYFDLRANGTADRTDAEGKLRAFIGELGLFYTVVAPQKPRGWGAFRLDVLGGVRVSVLELGIESDSAAGDASTDRTVYDPYVGARLELGLTDWLSFNARADVGGFGIDAWPTSDLCYNLEAGLEFRLGTCCALGVGYRLMSYEFDADAPGSSLDTTLQGPVFSLKFVF